MEDEGRKRGRKEEKQDLFHSFCFCVHMFFPPIILLNQNQNGLNKHERYTCPDTALKEEHKRVRAGSYMHATFYFTVE